MTGTHTVQVQQVPQACKDALRDAATLEQQMNTALNGALDPSVSPDQFSQQLTDAQNTDARVAGDFRACLSIDGQAF